MNLTEAPHLDRFFHGILSVARSEEGILINRMSPAQLAHYSKQAALELRAQCAAGVTLELRTDSPWLDMRFRILGRTRPCLGVDVEIDGQVVRSIYSEESGDTFSERLFDYPKDDQPFRLVRIHFPHNCILEFQQLSLAPGATVEPLPPRPLRLLTLGDSITQGMDAVSPLAPYPVQLARLFNAELLNQGVGGDVFDTGSIDRTIAYQPHLVTVAYGTNDWSRGCTRSQVTETARDFVRKLRETCGPDIPIVVICPLWRDTGETEKAGGTLKAFSEAILDSIRGFENTLAVDGCTLVPHDPRFFADGTHPNELGFMHYAVNLFREVLHLRPQLQRHRAETADREDA